MSTTKSLSYLSNILILFILLFLTGCTPSQENELNITLPASYEFYQATGLTLFFGNVTNETLTNGFYQAYSSKGELLENVSCSLNCSSLEKHRIGHDALFLFLNQTTQAKQVISFQGSSTMNCTLFDKTTTWCVNSYGETVGFHTTHQGRPTAWYVTTYPLDKNFVNAQDIALGNASISSLTLKCKQTLDCVGTPYLSFLESFSQPLSFCFTANFTVLHDSSYGDINKTYSYCNETYQTYSIVQITPAGQLFQQLLNDTNRLSLFPAEPLHPEFMEKSFILKLLEKSPSCLPTQVSLSETSDGKMCFLFSSNSSCKLSSDLEGTYCFFNDSFKSYSHTSYNSKLGANQTMVWEKEDVTVS